MNRQSEKVSSIKELLAKNIIVAIASGDPREEYYLLKVTRNGPEILNKRIKDDLGICFPTGAKVLRGHFFVRREEDTSLHSYYLDRFSVQTFNVGLEKNRKLINHLWDYILTFFVASWILNLL